MTDNNSKNFNHALVRLKITLVVILISIVAYLLIALFTYNISDTSWSSVSSEVTTKNYAGPVGAYIASFLLAVFGVNSFFIPLLIIDFTRVLFMSQNKQKINYLMFIVKIIGITAIIISCCALAELYLSFTSYLMPQGSGGIMGYEIIKPIIKYLSLVGGSFALLIMLFIGLILYCGTIWLQFIKLIIISISKIIKGVTTAIIHIKTKSNKNKNYYEPNNFKNFDNIYQLSTNNQPDNIQNNDLNSLSKDEIFKRVLDNSNSKINDESIFKHKIPTITSTTQEHDNIDTQSSTASVTQKKVSIPKKIINLAKERNLLSMDLLSDPDTKEITIPQQEINENSILIEQTLNDFKINAKVVGAYPGPVITRYEIDLAPGTKASKLVSISQDLARALSTASIRVVEVIPSKSFVGIELPNTIRQMVRLKEVLNCSKFIDSGAATIMGIGVDTSGRPAFAELAKMPHLLVAGTTGSGKSVGINSMIISMLYKCMPNELKFIMIDPKMLELSVYNGIPHLLTPVITDMKEAVNSLRWCVKEMERRYAIMSATGVRNITLLNKSIEQAENAGKPLKDSMFIKINPKRAHEAPSLIKMPYIVIIVDEFADMVIVAGKKVEELIARLTQKARAAGIHIILATQRPSVDVVTGLIKANIPTRMSFQVSSKIDSRIMLDQQGAEQLLGQGDMLYLKPGLGTPIRIHGAFVEDDEVHRVVDRLKELGEPSYIKNILETSEKIDKITSSNASISEDYLYNEAVGIILKTQKASISSVQRKLKISYNRSVKLMNEMEKKGIISKINQNGMRDVLIVRKS